MKNHKIENTHSLEKQRMDGQHENGSSLNHLGAFANAVYERLYSEAIGPNGLSSTQLSILILCEYASEISIDDSSRLLGFSHSNMVRMVDALSQQKLVEKRKHVRDRRTVHLVITSKGSDRLDKYYQARSRVLSDISEVLSTEEKNLLDRLIGKMLITFPDRSSRATQICRYCEMIPCHTGGCPVADAVLTA